jgi:hypothetical protein
MRLGALCQALETAGRAGEAQTCSTLASRLEMDLGAATAAIEDHLGR